MTKRWTPPASPYRDFECINDEHHEALIQRGRRYRGWLRENGWIEVNIDAPYISAAFHAWRFKEITDGTA